MSKLNILSPAICGRAYLLVRETFGYEFRFRSNQVEHVLPRQIAMYLTHCMAPKMTYLSIGRFYSCLGRQTTQHSIAKIASERTIDNNLDQLLAVLAERLKDKPRVVGNADLLRSVLVQEALRRASECVRREREGS